MLLNVQSLRTKSIFIHEVIFSLNANLFALTETWLNSTPNDFIRALPCYLDFPGRERIYGGVGLIVDACLWHKLVHLDPSPHLNTMWFPYMH